MRRIFFSLFLLAICPMLWAQQHPHKPTAAEALEIGIPGKTIPGTTVKGHTSGNVVTYELKVSDTTVNYTGKARRALATNGQIPAPTLRFTEGDSARMIVTNRTEGTISFHWHGLILPNKYDGVPMLNTRLINPGDTYVFAFPIIQNGTYWYHSHTKLKEQLGQYGPIVIQPKEGIQTKEKVVLLSDWTNQRPWEVLRQLRRHTDWYALKRNAVMSYGLGFASGNFGTKLWLEWNRMPDMDLADVYYDAFLANGRLADAMPEVQAGEKVRLRLINGSAASHFWLHYVGGPMRVVAVDGIDVKPVSVDKLLIATAETYDVEVEIPAEGSWEFRATSWDRYKHTSVWLGSGTKHPARDLPPVDYFALANEMKDMMQMMPGMTMGRAPAQIPQPTVYPYSEAPDYPVPDSHMHMEGGKEASDTTGMQHDGHMPMHEKLDMPHDKHEAEADSGSREGQVLRADEQGKLKSRHQADSAANHMKGQKKHPSMQQMKTDRMQDKMKNGGMKMHSMGGGPMGVQMTGYKQLKEQFPDESILDYTMLQSAEPTRLPKTDSVRVIHLYLGGNMLRYVWMINNKPLSKSDRILINSGETVRFVMHNTTMMSHPMHLHGHFFRVINGQGVNAPLKHTVNVAPMETTTIEFLATEDRDWFFHCHLLYHMLSGMARVIGYQNTDFYLDTDAKFKKFALEDQHWYPKGSVTGLSNSLFADLGVFNIYHEFNIEADADYHGNYEVEAKFMRYIGPKQFFAPYLGYQREQEVAEDPEGRFQTFMREDVATLGLRYFLPMMIWADARVDHKGNFNIELEREDIAITQRWRASAGVEYDFEEWEYTVGSSYILSQYISLAGTYHSDYGLGFGLRLTY